VGTGVFTLNFATGADLMVVTNAVNANLDAASQTGIVILVGATSVVAADFI
jgi:gamma-glutamylcysteine synthetase